MKKKHLISYIVCSGISLIMFLIGIINGKLFAADSLMAVMHILSDAFLFPAVAVGGIGLMSFIAKEGTFDMLGYGFSLVAGRFTHPRDKQESFFDYKMRKDENRSEWLLEALVVGAVCLLLSVLCLVVYFMQ